MSNVSYLKIEIQDQEKEVLCYEIHGIRDLKFILSTQVSKRTGAKLFDEMPQILLETTKKIDSGKGVFTPLELLELFVFLRAQVGNLYSIIDAYLQRSEFRSNKPFVGNNYVELRVNSTEPESKLNRLEDYRNKLYNSNCPLDRVIDICTYGKAMNHMIKMYWYN